jgi:hypothetical protein
MTPELAEAAMQVPGIGLLLLMWIDLRRQVRSHERRIVKLETKAGVEDPREAA